MTRPEKEIDWKLVDHLIEAGCPGTEIASKFDMHPDTLYRRVLEKYNMGFTDYCASKAEGGKANIRSVRYTKALKGDPKMILHLSKHMLGEWDKIDQNQISPEMTSQMLALLAQLQSMQQKPETNQIDLNNCETNNSVETQS
jgi:hypothetical protein